MHQQTNLTGHCWVTQFVQAVQSVAQAVQKLMDWLEKAEASRNAEARALVDHLQAQAAQRDSQVVALQSIATALVTKVCRSLVKTTPLLKCMLRML